MQPPFSGRFIHPIAVIKTLNKKDHILTVQYIGYTLFAVGNNNFQFVSAIHELNAIMFQPAFKPTPIVTGLGIVRLIINSAHNVSNRELPTVVFVIPDRPHLAIIEKPYRLLIIT